MHPFSSLKDTVQRSIAKFGGLSNRYEVKIPLLENIEKL
jgi:hypothetical protein